MSDIYSKSPLTVFMTKTLPELMEESKNYQNKMELLKYQQELKIDLLNAKNANAENIKTTKQQWDVAIKNFDALNKDIAESLDELDEVGIVASNLELLKQEDQTEGGKEFYEFINTGKGTQYNGLVEQGSTMEELLVNLQNKNNEGLVYKRELDMMLEGVAAGERAGLELLASGLGDYTGDDLVTDADMEKYLEMIAPAYKPGTPHYQGFVAAGPSLEEARKARKADLDALYKEAQTKKMNQEIDDEFHITIQHLKS